MWHRIYVILVWMTIGTDGVLAQEVRPQDLRDYRDLKHTIYVEAIRAGNHDPETLSNDYLFSVKLTSMMHTPEELNKKPEDRKKIEQTLGEFGAIHVAALSHWKRDRKIDQGMSFELDGDIVRDLVARSMAKFETTEDKVIVLASVHLHEQKSEYIFLTETHELGKVEYYPVPPALYRDPPRTDLNLYMSDGKGMAVTIGIRYKKPLKTID